MKPLFLIVTLLLFQKAVTQCEDQNETVAAGYTSCQEMQECIRGCLNIVPVSPTETIQEDESNSVYPSTTVSECGAGEWKRIAHLNMSNANESCPSEWKQYTTPVRCCGKKSLYGERCDSKLYSTGGRRYTKVCGRILGFRYGYTNSFHGGATSSADERYVDGLSITHGTNPRYHIWTYSAGNSERYNSFLGSCPCAGGNGVRPPSFVGENYHCESGYAGGRADPGVVFLSEDVLWDGQRCEGSCCNKSPPWFSVTVKAPSTDDIEVRICGGGNGEDTPIKLLELYVQ